MCAFFLTLTGGIAWFRQGNAEELAIFLQYGAKKDEMDLCRVAGAISQKVSFWWMPLLAVPWDAKPEIVATGLSTRGARQG